MIEVLVFIPALRVEYNQFKIVGLRGPVDVHEERILHSPLASGYASVLCQTGHLEPSEFSHWTVADPVAVNVNDLRVQCWEGAPEWLVPLKPGRYALVTAVQPAVVPPELELLSLTERAVVVEHRLHFTPML